MNSIIVLSCQNLMFRNFKVCIIAIGQPPESPFSKGDLRKSINKGGPKEIPINKGGEGVVFHKHLPCI